MTNRPSKFIRLISNIAATFMPTSALRKRVRHAIRRTQARTYAYVKSQWATRGDKIIPARYDEYDLVFVIGATCFASHVADNFKLRTFSNPMEWCTGADPVGLCTRPNIWRDSRFNEKIKYLCDDFKNFFNYEDFVLRASQPTFGSDNSKQEMLNTRTQIMYPHLFPKTDSWERYFPTAHETIMRRGERLINAIANSDRILIIWAHRLGPHQNYLDAPVSDDDVKRAVKMLNKKWPGKHFDLVFFEHDGTKGRFEFDKINVCDGAYRIMSNHFDNGDAYNFKHPAKAITHTPPLVMAEMLDNIKLVK